LLFFPSATHKTQFISLKQGLKLRTFSAASLFDLVHFFHLMSLL